MTNRAVRRTVVLALGSNLAQPEQQVRSALQAVAALPDTELLAASSLYLTAPVGYADQPDFINAVCLIQTALEAEALLAALQRIEQVFGRERSFRNAPRTLDLDIIDYAGRVSTDEHLILPHPRAHLRSFVMQPLAEIAPDFQLGGQGRAADVAARLGSDGIRKL